MAGLSAAGRGFRSALRRRRRVDARPQIGDTREVPRLRQEVLAGGDLDRPVELLERRGGDCGYVALPQSDDASTAPERARFQITANDHEGMGRSK
jgi:hypothetical protein